MRRPAKYVTRMTCLSYIYDTTNSCVHLSTMSLNKPGPSKRYTGMAEEEAQRAGVSIFNEEEPEADVGGTRLQAIQNELRALSGRIRRAKRFARMAEDEVHRIGVDTDHARTSYWPLVRNNFDQLHILEAERTALRQNIRDEEGRENRRQRALAMAMATHGRLGPASSMRDLPHDILMKYFAGDDGSL